MEPEKADGEQSHSKFENLHKVTPLSKNLAMALFVALPFVGGWIGYINAPVKYVEVEKIVEVVRSVKTESGNQTEQQTPSRSNIATEHYKDVLRGYSVNYPEGWRVESSENGIQFFNYPESQVMFAQKWPEGGNKIEGGGGIVVSLDNVENLSDYTLVQQNGLEFYRLDPNAYNEARWISIFIPYPQDETRALRFAVYGDVETREQMLTEFLEGFSFIQGHFLTFNGDSFEISTSSTKEGRVIYTSNSPIYFYLPSFPKNDWLGTLSTEGIKLNEKIYLHLWVQSVDNVPSERFLREDYYEWHLGEYDIKTGDFKLLMDSSYLTLDETYENERVLYLSPQSDFPNSSGNIILNITFCEECGPGPWHYGVLNYNTKELVLIGRATDIEWINDYKLRYKTESELGVSKLDSDTKKYIDTHYMNCADHPITCYQQIDWEQIPWQEVSF